MVIPNNINQDSLNSMLLDRYNRTCNGISQWVQTFITSNYVVELGTWIIIGWRKPFYVNISMVCTIMEPLPWHLTSFIYIISSFL